MSEWGKWSKGDEIKTEQSTSVFYLNVYLYSLLCSDFSCVEFFCWRIYEDKIEPEWEKIPHKRGCVVFVVCCSFFGLGFLNSQNNKKIFINKDALTHSHFVTCNSALCLCVCVCVDSKYACVVHGLSLESKLCVCLVLTVIDDDKIPCECFIFRKRVRFILRIEIFRYRFDGILISFIRLDINSTAVEWKPATGKNNKSWKKIENCTFMASSDAAELCEKSW